MCGKSKQEVQVLSSFVKTAEVLQGVSIHLNHLTIGMLSGRKVLVCDWILSFLYVLMTKNNVFEIGAWYLSDEAREGAGRNRVLIESNIIIRKRLDSLEVQ